MREFTYQEAVARMKFRLGLADVEALLDEAISAGRVAARIQERASPEHELSEFPSGGITWIDAEYDDKLRIGLRIGSESVNAADLERWLDELTGMAAPTDETATQYQSGLPGRPNSKQLIEAELRRRIVAGEIADSLEKEGAYLSHWLESAHPFAPRAQPKTIKNNIREEYKKARNNRP